MPVINGITQCGLCGHSIRDRDEIISFWAFVSNQADPLWIFSDKAFHRSCFLANPYAELALSVYEDWLQKGSNKICVVCHQIIVNPDDYIGFGLLTSDKNEDIYRYNNLHFHRQHVSQWVELPQAYHLLEAYQSSRKWIGDGLKRLLQELEKYLVE